MNRDTRCALLSTLSSSTSPPPTPIHEQQRPKVVWRLLCVTHFLCTGDHRTDTRDSFFQRLQVFLARVPQYSWIGIVIIMPQHVADSGDSAPRDMPLIIL